jgi:hypothetical protein
MSQVTFYDIPSRPPIRSWYGYCLPEDFGLPRVNDAAFEQVSQFVEGSIGVELEEDPI